MVICVRKCRNYFYEYSFIINTFSNESVTIKASNMARRRNESMDNRKFGYIRVSSKDQNEGRQLEVMKEIQINERDIFIDRKSDGTLIENNISS